MPQSSVLETIRAQSDSASDKAKAQPRKHPNTKRTGELAEAAFVVKAASLGYAVSKPWGDSERYDFILDSGPRTWRVQIKCTESLNANGYQVQSTYTDQKKKGHYTPADIDVLVGLHPPTQSLVRSPRPRLPRQRQPPFLPRRQHQRTPSPLRAIPRSLAPLPATATQRGPFPFKELSS